MTGYCMKCRKSREIRNSEQVTMKNGRTATKGHLRTVRHHYIQDGEGVLTSYGRFVGSASWTGGVRIRGWS